MNNRTHSVLLTRPHYCPTALIILIPPRGIGWDCTAMECSPLAAGSKCSRAEGKESNNKIKGFVTLQIYQEANSLCLWAHEVAGVRRGVWGKQQRLQSNVNPLKALPQKEWRATTPCHEIVWTPWKGSTTLSKSLARSFSLSLLIKRRHQHQLRKTPENIREQQLCSIHQDSSILPFVVTTRMQHPISKPFGIQHVIFSLPQDSFLCNKPLTCTNIY